MLASVDAVSVDHDKALLRLSEYLGKPYRLHLLRGYDVFEDIPRPYRGELIGIAFNK